MTAVFDTINKAFNLYQKDYGKVITAFIALLAITVIVAVLSFILSLSLSVTETACESSTLDTGNIASGVVSNILCKYMQPSSLIETGLSWVIGIVVILIILAVIKPLEELILAKERITEWTSRLSTQISNAVKLFIFDTLVGLVTFIPILILLILLIPDFTNLLSTAISGQDPGRLGGELNSFLLKSLGVLSIGLIVGVLIELILVLSFTFVRIELALTNQGLISAVNNSLELFRNNKGQVLMFHLAWFLISIVVGVLTLITCCMAIFVGPILSYLLVLPVRLLSEIIFWKELKSRSKDTITHAYSRESTTIY
ncbi:MAG: hypothetical protein U9Q22_01180 [Candidatus Altiarchaeota archaeon]|nr:hypothetical protein [Candidatus Altiarchaeota archaeon]